MSLMRGLADDLPLMRWLEEHIWPAESKHVSPAFVKDGTLLACAEMLRGGVTCFNDMYFFPGAALEAALEAGMRVSLGMIVLDFPSAYGADPDDYLAKGLALRDRWREHPLVSFCLAPHAPYTVSDATFRKIAKLAGEVDVPVHIHLHETADEIARSLAEHGVRPLERLQRLGLLGPGPDRGACRASRRGRNRAAGETRRLGGALPVVQPEARERLRAGGENGGRGRQPGHRHRRRGEQQPPGHVRGNAARCAARQGGRAATPRRMPAHAALRAATLGGAAALGLEARIGSIVAGQGRRPGGGAARRARNCRPATTPLSHLVYAAGREHVSDVWVAGKRLLRDGTFADAAREFPLQGLGHPLQVVAE